MEKVQKKSKPEGIFIEELMEAKTLKNKDVAERIGTTDATVSRLLNGQRGLDLDWLHKFAQALDVPLWKLFQPPEADKPASALSALRSALIAYGVDVDDLPAVMKAISGFVSEPDDEQSLSDQPHDQSAPANRRRVSTP